MADNEADGMKKLFDGWSADVKQTRVSTMHDIVEKVQKEIAAEKAAEQAEDLNVRLRLEEFCNELSTSSLKEFTLNFMSSDGHFYVEPEEGLSDLKNTDLYEDYLRQKNQFFLRFWQDTLMPKLSQEQLLDFLVRMYRCDLGPEFMPALEEYASKYSLKN